MDSSNSISSNATLSASGSAPPLMPTPIINLETFFLIKVCLAAFIFSMTLFGVPSNIVNIIIFAKQGFSDSVNIHLMNLAIADLLCLLSLSVAQFFSRPYLVSLNVDFTPRTLSVFAVWPYFAMTQIGPCFTALITLERCVCIVFPLKVKTWVTPRRVTVAAIFVWLIIFIYLVARYATMRFIWALEPTYNRTMYIWIIDRAYINIDSIINSIFGFAIPFASFLITLVCTIAIVVSLKRKSKWRAEASATTSKNAPNRDNRVTKMVSIISSFYIVCYAPMCAHFLGTYIDIRFSIHGPNPNLVSSAIYMQSTLQALNSVVNIFFYYSMSSRYRSLFKGLFCLSDNSKLKE